MTKSLAVTVIGVTVRNSRLGVYDWTDVAGPSPL